MWLIQKQLLKLMTSSLDSVVESTACNPLSMDCVHLGEKTRRLRLKMTMTRMRQFDGGSESHRNKAMKEKR